jgi:hypothetical protein
MAGPNGPLAQYGLVSDPELAATQAMVAAGTPMGPLKYILNSPQMHIWHHSYDLPPGKNGVNYGITLSVWDWLFGEAYIPSDGRDIVLGFTGVEQYPHSFVAQNIEPFAAIVHSTAKCQQSALNIRDRLAIRIWFV